jgi:hypothetical protein
MSKTDTNNRNFTSSPGIFEMPAKEGTVGYPTHIVLLKGFSLEMCADS